MTIPFDDCSGRRRAAELAFLLTVAWAATAAAQTPTYAPEFQVNTNTPSYQSGSAIARTGDGGFVVSWWDSGLGIKARKYAPDGSASTGEIPALNGGGGGRSDAAGIAGSFAVVVAGNDDGDDTSINLRLFANDGVPISSEFVVNSYTTNLQQFPAIDAVSSSELVVVWAGEGPGDSSGVFGQRFDSTASPIGTAFLVNSYTTGTQSWPAVAARSDGSFVVAWREYEDSLRTGFGDAVYARLLDSTGSPLGGEIFVHDEGNFDLRDPRVATLPGGQFAVAWHHFTGTNLDDVQARFFSAAGAPATPAFVVSAYATGRQASPDVAAIGTGEFLVVWDDELAEPGTASNVRARRFLSDGTPVTGDFRINAYTHERQFDAKVLADPDGGFTAVWTSWDQDGDRTGIFGIRQCLGSGPDADGDGVADDCDACVNLDGLLIDIKPRLRFKFVNTETSPRNDRFSLTGETTLPGGTTFGDLDPMATPFGFHADSDDRVGILDGLLPTSAFGGRGTAGWKVNGNGSTWTFIDKSGAPVEGIVKVSLKDRSKKAPGQVRLKVKARDDTFVVGLGSVPLRAAFVFGDASAGQCFETSFVAGECRFTGLDSRLGCKK